MESLNEYGHPGLAAAQQWIGAGAKSLLIDGRWMAARSGQTLETLNPATEQVLTHIAQADAADVDLAVAAARRALEAPSWKGISPHARSRALLRIADAIEQHADELSALESLDNGMPAWFSKAAVSMAVDVLRYYAGWPSKILGTTNPTDDSNFIYTLREPVGVCGQINPWNVPMLLIALKVAPPLACGNTVVLKPSELASLTSLRVAELIQETDLPPGVLNVVTGYGSTVGAAISAHMGIDKVSFTGSTAVGKQILHASTGNMKRTTLELGGKSPNIIFADADIDKAVTAAVLGFTRNSGQICSSGTRIFVQHDILDEVTEKITRLAASQTVGSPFDPHTRLGPVISATQLQRVLSYIESGSAEGATLATGGQRLPGKGYFLPPTVFSHATNSMKVAREEIFGPVSVILPFKDEEDAIALANDSIYGLAGGIWTRDISKGHRMAKALRGGRIWVNTFGETDAVMPFGGFKESGLGREFGLDSVMTYTETKSVQIRF